jgi:hypothetical protein
MQADGTRPGCHSFPTLVPVYRTCPGNRFYDPGRETGSMIGA